VNVGFSYSEDERINNTPAAAEDVYAFLQVFLHRDTEYHAAPFSGSQNHYLR
jgi:cathepsin A (carboxypeptidase C)